MTPFPRPVAALLALLLSAAGGRASAAPDEFLYTVQPGDSVWTLAARYLHQQHTWQDLRTNNQLRNDRLQPGQVLRIPLPWLRLTTQEARLAVLQGGVTLNSGTGWTAARADTALPPGTWLRTPADGTATLLMQDGTRVLVRPSSELRLIPLDRAQQEAWIKAQPASDAGPRTSASTAPVRIELLRGGLESTVQPQRDDSRFEIRTPSAVTTVRGTEFRVSADADSTRAEVVHGRVDFGNALGNVPLGTATGSRADLGLQPVAAVPLLAAPALEATADTLSADQIRALRWPPIDGAVAYRVQWFGADRPARLLHESVQEQVQPDVPPLTDGPYQLRVRAIDAMGLEGLPAARSLTLRTPPPRPRTPPLDVHWLDRRVELRWPPLDPQACVQVQIATDSAFAQVVLDELTPREGLNLPAPHRPGPYLVRVRVLQTDGGRSGWSEPRAFDPRSPQEPPP
ncbi:FecR domain-containing protein [uncultured Sphaerotilus sp.]|uniref:FecR domain-containing protein n=1 Tax=uncultured Sphaerotilus sp. TaxID=474984 RepID=UPI0030CA597C